MIVCGVEIRGKEAILALAQGSPEESVHAECATKKLTLLDDRDTKFLLTLKSAIQAFALQNKVDAFVIKNRQATGPRAGGGITFKIETLFQLQRSDFADITGAGNGPDSFLFAHERMQWFGSTRGPEETGFAPVRHR